MKKLLIAICTLAATTFAALPAGAQSQETRKVCVDVKKDGKPVIDPKTGKTQQSCKEVKVHKKLEGTEVPKK